MADETNKADDAEAKARAAETKAGEAQAKANDADKSSEQRAADKAADKADDQRAAAEQAKRVEGGKAEPTTAAEAKSMSALAEPDRPIGDHHAQKFGTTPENPQLAPGLDPDADGKVKLTMVTSDFPDPANPMVTYVHPEMVGDYQRAGWSRA